MIYLNGDPINVTMFPDNTSQVWKLDEKYWNFESVKISWDYSHEGELMHVAQLKHLLDYLGIERIYLEIRYLPYGRQDKWIDNNLTFALHTFAYLINTLHFTEVFIMDPHSKVALDSINRSQAMYPHGQLRRAIWMTDAELFCYPDKGAVVKYTDVYKDILPYIYGEKVRDQATGYITSYEVIGDCRDNKVLIVDDICDGGATFEVLTDDLYDRGAKEVNLFVTHGLFTKGLRPLHQAGIRRIFTAKGEAIRMPDGGFGFKSL